ncbi:MAG: hypothetical protein AAFX87_06745 [Bacteroidota bacterium]
MDIRRIKANITNSSHYYQIKISVEPVTVMLNANKFLSGGLQ